MLILSEMFNLQIKKKQNLRVISWVHCPGLCQLCIFSPINYYTQNSWKKKKKKKEKNASYLTMLLRTSSISVILYV